MMEILSALCVCLTILLTCTQVKAKQARAESEKYIQWLTNETNAKISHFVELCDQQTTKLQEQLEKNKAERTRQKELLSKVAKEREDLQNLVRLADNTIYDLNAQLDASIWKQDSPHPERIGLCPKELTPTEFSFYCKIDKYRYFASIPIKDPAQISAREIAEMLVKIIRPTRQENRQGLWYHTRFVVCLSNEELYRYHKLKQQEPSLSEAKP